MRYEPSLILAVLLFSIAAGCTESVKETLSPELTITIESMNYRNETDEGYVPLPDHVWLYLELNITNNNEKGSVPVTAYQFFLIDNYDDEVWCRGYVGSSEPTVAPGESIDFTIYFQTTPGREFVRLEYRRTLSEPVTTPI